MKHPEHMWDVGRVSRPLGRIIDFNDRRLQAVLNALRDSKDSLIKCLKNGTLGESTFSIKWMR